MFIRLDDRLNIVQFQKVRYPRNQDAELLLLSVVPEKSETYGRTLANIKFLNTAQQKPNKHIVSTTSNTAQSKQLYFSMF